MESSNASKRKFEETLSDNAESNTSVVYCVNLGDPGNTMPDESTSEEGENRGRLSSYKRIKLSGSPEYDKSDSDDSDCQVISCILPSKINQEKDGDVSDTDSLCQNQMMDKKVREQWEQDLEYYADNETEQEPPQDDIKERGTIMWISINLLTSCVISVFAQDYTNFL